MRRLSLETGLGYFEVQGAGQAGQPGQGGSIRIRFGDSVVTAGGFSVLRINLDNPPGELAVFSGNAHLERGSGLAVDLHGGESLALNGADATKYELTESIEPDSWDAWNSDRDQMLTSEASSKTGATKGFADSSNPAWNDLDANGNWYDVPGQGNIWSPYEASGFGMGSVRERGLDVDAAVRLLVGCRVIRGVTCPTNVETGTTTTALGGVGRLGWGAARPGGAAVLWPEYRVWLCRIPSPGSSPPAAHSSHRAKGAG